MVTGVIGLPAADTAVHDTAGKNARAKQAAQDFEALLIANLLRSMQQSFSTLGEDDKKPAGLDDYHYMATQAVASAIAAGGGFGLSRLILKQLVRSG